MFYLKFKTSPLDKVLKIESLRGFEEISSLYKFSVVAYTDDDSFNGIDYLKKEVIISVNLTDDERFFYGIISKIEERESLDDENGVYLIYYNITIVPSFWELTLLKDCRIFQNKSDDEIVSSLLKEKSITEFDMQCDFSMDRDICVQYNESPFSFISRILEENGVFYYFDHSRNKLVFLDSIYSCSIDAGSISFTRQHQDPFLNVITNVSFSYEMVSSGFQSVDYNYETPSLKLRTQGINHSNVYEFPGKFNNLDDGNAYASQRFQELQFNAQVLRGKSTAIFFSPGTIFTLIDHPRDSFNQQYFIYSVKHEYLQSKDFDSKKVYSNEFVAIPIDSPFRPKCKTPKPKIYSQQSAIVTGPKGEEIYCDEYGRIKIWFHWDIWGKEDEKSCCFVRVAQNWAGKGFGGLIIPRIGMEVVVGFIEGDPDRPLVIGCVYHNENTPPPYPGDTPEISTFKTRTSPGGDGYNELRFNDKKSEEEIFMHAQKDVNVVIEDSRTELFIKGSDTKTLKKGDVKEIQKGKETKHLLKIKDGDQIFKIKKGDRKTILDKGDRNLTIKKGNSTNLIKKGNYTYTIKKGNQKSTIKNGDKSILMKKGDFTTTIKKGNKSLTISSGNYNIKIKNGNMSVKVNGNISFKATGNISFKADQNIKLDAGMNIETKSGIMTQNKAGQMISNKSEVIMSKANMLIKNDSKMSIMNKAGMMFKSQSEMMYEIKSGMMLKMDGGLMLQAKGGLMSQYQGGMMSEHKGGMMAQHSGGILAMVKGVLALIN